LYPWDEDFKRCPWSLFTPPVLMCLGWWRDWRDLKVLPYEGADLMDQPAYVLDAIRACEGPVHEQQARGIEEQQEELRRVAK